MFILSAHPTPVNVILYIFFVLPFADGTSILTSKGKYKEVRDEKSNSKKKRYREDRMKPGKGNNQAVGGKWFSVACFSLSFSSFFLVVDSMSTFCNIIYPNSHFCKNKIFFLNNHFL